MILTTQNNNMNSSETDQKTKNRVARKMWLDFSDIVVSYTKSKPQTIRIFDIVDGCCNSARQTTNNQ